MGIMKKLVVFLMVLTVVSKAVHAQKFSPDLKWFTIETPNFYVHYPAGEENFARRAGSIAEEVHGILIQELKWKPADKTHILHIDTVKGANKVARDIFGRFPGFGFSPFFPIFPNMFQPIWLIEGMAMYHGSRLVDNPEEFEVLYSELRVAVAEDRLNSISQASTYDFSTWPGDIFIVG